MAVRPLDFCAPSASVEAPDFGDIRGQAAAKRAMQVAAAGGHGILLWGLPGRAKPCLRALCLPYCRRFPKMRGSKRLSSIPLRASPSILFSLARGRFVVCITALRWRAFVGPGNARASRRDIACSCRRSVPRRIAGVLVTIASSASPAHGNGPHRDKGRWQRCASRAIFSCRGGESLSLRVLRRPQSNAPAHNGKSERYQGNIGGPLLDRIDIHVDVWRCDPGESQSPMVATIERLLAGVWLLVRFRSWRRAALGDGDAVDVGALLLAAAWRNERGACWKRCRARSCFPGRGITRALMVARPRLPTSPENRSRWQKSTSWKLWFQASKGGIAAMEERFRIDGPRFNRTWHEDYQMSSRLCLSRPNGSM